MMMSNLNVIRLFTIVALVSACSSTSTDVPADADGAHDASTPTTIDADLSKRKIVRIRGQSNARGIGLTSDLSALGRDDLIAPLDAVPFMALYGNDGTPQITTDYPSEPLRPLVDRAGVERFGIELTLGRALELAEPGRWAIAKFTADSTALGGEWNPFGYYPMQPAGGPNLYTMSAMYGERSIADLDGNIAVDVWVQGETDARQLIGGQQYGMREASFIAAVRYDDHRNGHPRVPFIIGRLNAATFGDGTVAVREGQAVVAESEPDVSLVDQDPFPIRTDDNTHFTSAALIGLGDAYAAAILAVAGDPK